MEFLYLNTERLEFRFNDIIYAQIDGISMGNPLDRVLVYIFGGYLENVLKNATSPTFIIANLMIFFSVFSSMEKAEAFHLQLYSLHPSLRFTMEEERDSSLPFLDVPLGRRTVLVSLVFTVKLYLLDYRPVGIVFFFPDPGSKIYFLLSPIVCLCYVLLVSSIVQRKHSCNYPGQWLRGKCFFTVRLS